MNKALQGDAAIVADSLADDCTWIELLNALRAKFTEVSSLDVMMGSLHGIKTRHSYCVPVCHQARKSSR